MKEGPTKCEKRIPQADVGALDSLRVPWDEVSTHVLQVRKRITGCEFPTCAIRGASFRILSHPSNGTIRSVVSNLLEDCEGPGHSGAASWAGGGTAKSRGTLAEEVDRVRRAQGLQGGGG